MNIEDATLDALPEKSLIKYQRMVTDKAAAYSAYRTASDVEQEARQELGRMSGRIETGVSDQARKLSDETLATIRQPAEAAKRRHQLSLDARDRAAAKLAQFDYVDSLSEWLQRTLTPNADFEHSALVAPTTKDLTGEIARVRSKIEKLAGEWDKAERAPAPASDLKARAFASIDKIAADGAPSISATARGGDPLRLGDRLASTPRSGPNESLSLVGDGGASFFVWLFRDEISDRIGAMIDAIPVNGALTDDEREVAFASISQQRLNLERTEEALLCVAEADGRTIARRRDADPRAILELSDY